MFVFKEAAERTSFMLVGSRFHARAAANVLSSIYLILLFTPA